MGFQADIIIWDLQTQTQLAKLSLHKVQIASLSFSLDDKFLISLGSQDDNNVVLWDMQTFTAISGHPASSDSSGSTLTVKFHSKGFITGKNFLIPRWCKYS
jgi:WD40 repeat protein